ncbi:hypothetical protein MA16_Dca004268 [Dendrobium catenatum]|uniref:DUF4283 domain-containing protein n=1 Tax=Dendrobium catenatum TaxID=906689 RepID=A0A2I0W6Z2_9ASPA|nr:hypothetical protein MA16_Dca004268 [Dendrobium catenatum]
MDIVRLFFANLKLSGFYSVGLLNSRHVAIQLSNDLDYSRIFARRSYFINNCQMKVLKWTPFFDIHDESPIVPIWISFLNLLLHFLILKFYMRLDLFLEDRYKLTRPLHPELDLWWLEFWWKWISPKNMQKKSGLVQKILVTCKRWNTRRFWNFVPTVKCMGMAYPNALNYILNLKKL